MEKIYKVLNYTIPVITVLFILMPLVVWGQLPQPTPPIGGTEITLQEVEDIINRIANWLIAISLVVAVIVIIIGGIRWMTARDNEEALKSAKGWVKNGIIGALIVLAVGVILKTLGVIVTRSFFQ